MGTNKTKQINMEPVDNQVYEQISNQIRKKLHEELISDIEWARTIDSGEHYLITDNVIINEFKSYNSFDSLVESGKAYLFLKENGVI